jgi:dephospho-CoA kinase
MLRVGITGGIASGKTTVAEMFRARGCAVLNADHIAHQTIRPGQPAYDEVVRAFGRIILAVDGSVDRGRLGKIVFADRAQLEQLNQIVHPRVIEAIEAEFDRLEEKDPQGVALVEAALLVEAGYHEKLDKLIVTRCRPEQQIARLSEQKNLSPAEAKQRIAAQLSPEKKRHHADYEIDCSGSLEETEEQVDRLFDELKNMAGNRLDSPRSAGEQKT